MGLEKVIMPAFQKFSVSPATWHTRTESFNPVIFMEAILTINLSQLPTLPGLPASYPSYPSCPSYHSYPSCASYHSYHSYPSCPSCHSYPSYPSCPSCPSLSVINFRQHILSTVKIHCYQYSRVVHFPTWLVVVHRAYICTLRMLLGMYDILNVLM